METQVESRLDHLTRKYTGFQSFDAMLEPHTDYFPSLGPMVNPELKEIADAYDAAQTARGDHRRAYRYQN